ncbi:hypothetical protein [Bradyrhizobium quebecense]|uniref:Uncharacterized protein n=2 Tax=Bradyrhizobium quebecense TaxID=2748629 RepID=A0ABS3MBY3_9BRAD|nr:hypothetical protein [Bradyrhizobium quebecense]UGY04325.1 hypothetical protein J4P68_0006095 [Bradyrhizobium quebecense]
MIRRGVWHQLGFNTQIVVKDFLQAGVGVGVIVSPKDLAHDKAIEHATQYRSDGANVLLDPQFYVPEYSAGKVGTYPTAAFRQSITSLGAVTERDLDGLARALEDENRKFGTTAVIAPALPYEAARPDIVALNSKLFRAAKRAGDAIGVPTYGTVAISQTLSNMELVEKALSSATAEEADGWYSTFEFKEERLPTDVDDVFRFANASLTLACTGAPVLHAFAGPLSILSFGSGATGAAVSFWQNSWGFNRERWKDNDDQQGGGGNAPPRFFSSPLWGTIVYPDESALIDRELRREIMQGTPFSGPTERDLSWDKWQSYRHLLLCVSNGVTEIAAAATAKAAMEMAAARLERAVDLNRQIERKVALRDNTSKYQPAWLEAARRMLADKASDYDYFEMTRPR